MEHRFCYRTAGQYIPNKFDAMSTINSPVTPETSLNENHEQNKQKLLKHLNITVQTQIGDKLRAILDNPEKLVDALRMYEVRLEDRLKETTGMFQTNLAQSKSVLASWGAPATQKVVINMINELQKDLPKKGERPHRYGTSTGINFDQIRNDRLFIDGFLNADNTPKNIKVALERVKAALGYLAEQDTNHLVWTFLQEKKANKFDQTIHGIGKTTIIIAALFAGVISGIPAIAKMYKEGKVEFKDFFAPLVCFGIAIPLANSDVRRMFASVESNMKTDLDITIRNPLFRQLCSDYEIEGAGWSRAFQKMSQHPAEMKALAANFRSGYAAPEKKTVDKAIDTYVNRLSLGKAEATGLRKMINDGRFATLSHILSGVRTKEGQKVIVDYVGMGARRYENNAYALRDTLKKEDTMA